MSIGMRRFLVATEKAHRDLHPGDISPLVNEEEVEELASMGLTKTEIASVLKVDPSTLKRYTKAIEKGHERRNASLRRKQYEVAMSGNTPMLIWLGRQYLNQMERQEITRPDDPLLELLSAMKTRYNEIEKEQADLSEPELSPELPSESYPESLPEDTVEQPEEGHIIEASLPEDDDEDGEYNSNGIRLLKR
jgi:hypothetical protein